MINRESTHQRPDQVIDITGWDVHEDYDVFPVGARDKSLRVCPNPAPYDFCVPVHRYLFKEAIKSAKSSEPRYPDQYWAEVIAFQIGRLMGLTLPPVFVAIDSARNEPGTINEWFIGYADSRVDRYVAGGDYLQRLIPAFDIDKGRQHNLTTIIEFSRALERGGWLAHDWRQYWGLCLCFDALIGNTDRHQENWGVIWAENGPKARYTPYFDNGTSLGHELQPQKMQRMMRDHSEFNAYLKRGRHHMRWAKGEKKRLPLTQGVHQYCQQFPAIRPILIERLRRWCDDDLRGLLCNLTDFDLPHPFTQQRAEFVAFLTLARREQLLLALEK